MPWLAVDCRRERRIAYALRVVSLSRLCAGRRTSRVALRSERSESTPFLCRADNQWCTACGESHLTNRGLHEVIGVPPERSDSPPDDCRRSVARLQVAGDVFGKAAAGLAHGQVSVVGSSGLDALGDVFVHGVRDD